MKILYIASKAEDTASLRLEREITLLQVNAAAASGEEIEIIFLPDTHFEDLPGQIAKHRPDILHLSAHGEQEGLELLSSEGKPVSVTGEMLCAFLDVNPPPRLVYLSACDSGVIAQQLKKRVPIAIGTTAPISNPAAIGAALNFYARIFDGKSVHSAFETGRMIMEGIDKKTVSSTLVCQDGIDPKQHFLYTPAQIVARFQAPISPRDGGKFSIHVGLSGCPRNTVQVVFFTNGRHLSLSVLERARSFAWVAAAPVDGAVWLETVAGASGDQSLFACGVTAHGRHFSVSRSLCAALEEYYVTEFKLDDVASLPPPFQNAIASLRNSSNSAGRRPPLKRNSRRKRHRGR
ncbi:MAG: hypothetical protein WCE79_25010 [Xanthobacteraceae bacterium]